MSVILATHCKNPVFWLVNITTRCKKSQSVVTIAYTRRASATSAVSEHLKSTTTPLQPREGWDPSQGAQGLLMEDPWGHPLAHIRILFCLFFFGRGKCRKLSFWQLWLAIAQEPQDIKFWSNIWISWLISHKIGRFWGKIFSSFLVKQINWKNMALPVSRILKRTKVYDKWIYINKMTSGS